MNAAQPRPAWPEPKRRIIADVFGRSSLSERAEELAGAAMLKKAQYDRSIRAAKSISYQTRDDSHKGRAFNDRSDQIHRIISRTDGMTALEISERIGVSESFAQDVLRRMHLAGRLTRTRGFAGRYLYEVAG